MRGSDTHGVFREHSLFSTCFVFFFQCTDVDDDDWDISSLEEDRSIGRKAEREQKEPPPPVKKESNPTHVPNAWGAANPKGPKGEGS